MRTLRRYLWREIVVATVFVLFALLSLFMFFDMVQQLDEIGRRGFQLHHAFSYVALTLPSRTYELMPIAALIGVPLYVSIIPVIPIVLGLSAKGVSTGAVIAFMITATSISPPELIMLSGMFKRRYIALFVVMMIVGAIVTGYMFNLIPV